MNRSRIFKLKTMTDINTPSAKPEEKAADPSSVQIRDLLSRVRDQEISKDEAKREIDKLMGSMTLTLLEGNPTKGLNQLQELIDNFSLYLASPPESGQCEKSEAILKNYPSFNGHLWFKPLENTREVEFSSKRPADLVGWKCYLLSNSEIHEMKSDVLMYQDVTITEPYWQFMSQVDKHSLYKKLRHGDDDFKHFIFSNVCSLNILTLLTYDLFLDEVGSQARAQASAQVRLVLMFLHKVDKVTAKLEEDPDRVPSSMIEKVTEKHKECRKILKECGIARKQWGYVAYSSNTIKWFLNLPKKHQRVLIDIYNMGHMYIY